MASSFGGTQSDDSVSDRQRRTVWHDVVAMRRSWEQELARWTDDALRRSATDEWCAAEHALHVVLTAEVVADWFESPPVPADRRAFNPIEFAKREFIFTTGRLPSGIEAPAAAVPRVVLAAEEIVARLHTSCRRLEELVRRHVPLAGRRHHMPHPHLGAMNFVEWVRFLALHSDHHLLRLTESSERCP